MGYGVLLATSYRKLSQDERSLAITLVIAQMLYIHLAILRKRCYFRNVTKFSRFHLAAQKHIRGLLNLCWADDMNSLVILLLHNVNIIQWIDTFTCMYAITGGPAPVRKQSRWLRLDLSITNLHQHYMVNTQLLHVQNVHTKYCKYFQLRAVFAGISRWSWICCDNTRKLMWFVFEYFHFYSNLSQPSVTYRNSYCAMWPTL